MEAKRELFRFRVYDYEGIEKHLEEMANKGWMLMSTGNYIWKYEKCEPEAASFSIQYRKNGGSLLAYSSGKEEEEREALEKAEAKGWKYIDTWSNARIFYSENKQIEPIYEDEKEKIEDCRKIVNKAGLGVPAVLALLIAFIGYEIVSDLIKYPLDSLSSWSHIVAAFAVSLAFLAIIINLAANILWLNKAGKKPASVKINTRRYQILDGIQYCLLAITMVAFLLMVYKEDGAGNTLGVTGYMLLVILLIAGLSALFSKLKKKKIETAGWIGIVLAAFIAMFAVLMGYQIIIDDDGSTDVPIPDYAASYEDITGNKLQERESSFYSDTESSMVRMIRLDEYGTGTEQLRYYIAEVKNEKMYDWFFQKALMEDTYTWQEFLPAGAAPDSLWKEQDDMDWGVDKVFRIPGDDRWIFQKKNMIMYLELDFEPEGSQKAGIVKKLEETAAYEN